VVLRRDGLAELHQGEADVLLGASSEAASRSEWTLTLAPGDTLVLYTDGLVERRDVALDESLTDLVSRVANGAGESAEALSDRLLVELGSALEDDVVLAVLGVDAG
jgi:serine phosphatase RsbU (regulator of sigma subunit)